MFCSQACSTTAAHLQTSFAGPSHNTCIALLTAAHHVPLIVQSVSKSVFSTILPHLDLKGPGELAHDISTMSPPTFIVYHPAENDYRCKFQLIPENVSQQKNYLQRKSETSCSTKKSPSRKKTTVTDVHLSPLISLLSFIFHLFSFLSSLETSHLSVVVWRISFC